MSLWQMLSPQVQEEGEGFLRVTLSLALGPGREIRRMLASCGSAKATLERLEPATVCGEFEAQVWLRNVDREWKSCKKLGIQVLTPMDPNWPVGVDQAPRPPAFLLVRGIWPPGDAPKLAMVGSRHASEYGRRHARELSAAWARAGGTVVSGGAAGIDAVSHQACLDAGGYTLAILGSGLRSPYPAIHRNLFERIMGQGALLSEYPAAFPTAAYRFPERNRLVAALSDLVLVVQCREESGALHTARFAKQMGRELLVLPGPVDDPACAGSNRLLTQGAQLMSGWPRLEQGLSIRSTARTGLELPGVETKNRSGATGIDLSLLDPPAQRVLSALGEEVCHMDDLCATLNVSPSFLSAALLEFELQGWVVKELGNRYRLRVNLTR